MHWILDFDDTLAMGPNTWAFQVVLPDLIEQHDLPYDDDTYNAVMLDAQRRANDDDVDESDLLDDIFNRLNWPSSIQDELMHRVFSEYELRLFPDARPFVHRLHAAADHLFMISNNNDAPALLHQLDLASFFNVILTPDTAGARPKPHPDMWHTLQAQDELSLDPQQVIMVGDDPWSDGAFAQACGFSCWIIDRLERYRSLYDTMPYHFVTTLDDIPITSLSR